LVAIINYLRSSGDSSADFDQINGYLETLITNLTRFIRRPLSVKEGTLACNALSLLALYLGPHDRTVLTAAEKCLLQLVDRSDLTDMNDLRPIALFTYCFLVYIYEMEDTIQQAMDFLQQILLGITPEAASPGNFGGGIVFYTQEIKAKALDCWVLLGSHLSEHELLERTHDNEIFELITGLLESATNDIHMKVACGRTIAFLWETAHNSNESLSFEELGHLLCYNSRIVDETLNRKSKFPVFHLVSFELLFLSSCAVIRSISVDSSKKVSKRNKKEQRAEFRDIENWIDNREFPDESIRMQGAEIIVDSFGKERVVESLKTVLESGFHSSLRMYPVVK
jgi:hypothetical protein